MKRFIRRTLLLAIGAYGSAVAQAPSPSPSTPARHGDWAIVEAGLSRWGKAPGNVHLFNRGELSGRVEIASAPVWSRLSDSGEKLYVISAGKMKKGFTPVGPAVVQIIDLAGKKVDSSFIIGRQPLSAALSRDSKVLWALCAAEDGLELWALDLAAGRTLGMVKLASVLSILLYQGSDGLTAAGILDSEVLFWTTQFFVANDFHHSFRLGYLDPKHPLEPAWFDIPGSISKWLVDPAGQGVYVISAISRDAESGIGLGSLRLFDLQTREVRLHVELGTGTSVMQSTDDGTIYVSTTLADGSGAIRTLHEGKVTGYWKTPLGIDRLLLHEGRIRLGIGEQALLLFDEDFSRTRTVKLDFEPGEAKLIPGAHKLAIAAAAGDQVLLIDTSDGSVLARRKAGRRSMKALNATATTAMGVGNALSVMAIPLAVLTLDANLLQSAVSAGPLVLPLDRKTGGVDLELGPDKEVLYVMNPSTDDITLLATKDLEVIRKVAVGKSARRIFSHPLNDNIWALAGWHLTVIDSTGAKVARYEIKWRGPLDVSFKPTRGAQLQMTRDGKCLAVLDEEKLRVVMIETGESIALLEGFRGPQAAIELSPAVSR